MRRSFRARRKVLLDAAENLGIRPNPHAIALALGMSVRTVDRILNGGNASAQSVLDLCYGLKVPVEDGFTVVEEVL